MYNPVRGGNRGGKDQFKWENVRSLAYKDRECYLGSTVAIGFLDKGGKWRKKDWWINLNKKSQESEQLREEIRNIQAEDERRMKEALGISAKKKETMPQLNPFELNELTKKIKKVDEYSEKEERIHGLGFESDKNNDEEHETILNDKNNLLEGEGIDDIRKQEEKKIKKQLKKKIEKDKENKENKKKKKKHKKEKKEKKSKKHKKEKK